MGLKQRIYFARQKFELPGFTILGKDTSRQRKYIGFYWMFVCVGEMNIVGFGLKYQLIAYIQNSGYKTSLLFSKYFL